MHPRDLDAVLRAEGSAPIPFPYRKGDYALHLLLLGIGGGRPLSVLRQGPFRRLLEKPIVRRALASVSNGVLAPRHLEALFAAQRESFSVTLGRWGADKPRDWGSRYYQTSRPGQNLVVQLNFPASHDRAYVDLIKPREDHPFAMRFHPVRTETPFTLAWARLDVDFDAGEVLVEEVQCDWVREAEWFKRTAEESLEAGTPAHLRPNMGIRATAPQVLQYVHGVLSPYAALWAECVLAAAIAFSYERLSVRRIYFHTFEGGNLMKRMRCEPPRSLYTDLPQRFCFVETKRAPAAFRRDGRVKHRSPSWYALELV
jgi:hypothetical protein